MAKYGPKAQELVAQELKEMKEGTLRSGSGAKVTNPKQAIAIALSEARSAGAKMPPPPEGTAAAKKASIKSAGAKGTAVKNVPSKKTATTPKKTAK